MRCARQRLPAASAVRVACALPLPMLLSTLAEGYVGDESAEPGARRAALALMCELLEALDAATHAGEKGAPLSDPSRLEGPLLSCLTSILTHVCHAAYGGAGSGGRSGGAGGGGGGFRGSGLLQLALPCLEHLCGGRLLPHPLWASAFATASGTFWLSRCARATDAGLRARALSLLARLASPGAGPTHRLLAHAWPDAALAAAHAASDGSHGSAPRAAALRFLAAALALPDAATRLDTQSNGSLGGAGGGGGGGASLSPLAPSALLSHHCALWESLPGLARATQAQGQYGLVAAALGALLQGCLLDEDVFAGYLQRPGHLEWLAAMVEGPFPRDPDPAVCEPQPLPAHAAPQQQQLASRAPPPLHPHDAARVVAALGGGASGQPRGARSAGPPGPPRDGELDGLCVSWGLGLLPGRPPACPPPEGASDVCARLAVRCLSAQLLGVLAARGAPAGPPQPGARNDAPGAAAPHGHLVPALLRGLCELLAGVREWGGDAAAWGRHTAAQAGVARRRLAAAHEAAWACNAALQQLRPDALASAVSAAGASTHAGVNSVNGVDGGGGVGDPHRPPPLLPALAAALSCPRVPSSTKMALGCLVATLTSDGALASALLLVGGGGEGTTGGEEHLVSAGDAPGEPVGRVLCLSLVDALPAGALDIAASSDGTPLIDVSALSAPSAATAVVALRNVLAYSTSAKAAACESGLHASLLHACNVAATLGAAAERRAAAHPGRGAASVAASVAPSTAGTPKKRISVAGGSGSAAAAAGGPSAMLVPAGGLPSAAAAADAAAVASAALDQRLAVCLSLLKHLAYHGGGDGGGVHAQHAGVHSSLQEGAHVRDALVAAGAVDGVRRLWRHVSAVQLVAAPDQHGRSTSKRHHVRGSPALHEALGLLTNLVVGCPSARAQLAAAPGGGGGAGERGGGARGGTGSGGSGEEPSLLHGLCCALFGGQALEGPTHSALSTLVCHVAVSEDGTLALLKLTGLSVGGGGQLTDVVGAAVRVLRVAAEGPARDAPRDDARQLATWQLLVNMAAHGEGQKALLTSSSASGLMETIAAVVSPPEGVPRPGPRTVAGALSLARNLCFSPEAKAHLLSHPAMMPALLAHTEGVAEAPRAAAFASSALWALVYSGEKVKAALRRLPSAHERLTVTQSAIEWQLKKVARVGGMVAAAGGSGGGGKGSTGSGGGGGAGEAAQWLTAASDNVAALLGALNSTSAHAPASPARPRGEHNTGAGAGGKGRGGWVSDKRTQGRDQGWV
ncbi:hypothetical protein FOA52_012546 [Chlamydomonas sp. UWO 241]|nr:hypothetical protein FOA52_012546 [Chlamydomonas sp. UWO 241]